MTLTEIDHRMEGHALPNLFEEEDVAGGGVFEAAADEGGVPLEEGAGVGKLAGLIGAGAKEGGAGIWEALDGGQSRQCGQGDGFEPRGVVLAEAFAVGEAEEGGAVDDVLGALVVAQVVLRFGEEGEPEAEGLLVSRMGEAGLGEEDQREDREH